MADNMISWKEARAAICANHLHQFPIEPFTRSDSLPTFILWNSDLPYYITMTKISVYLCENNTLHDFLAFVLLDVACEYDAVARVRNTIAVQRNSSAVSQYPEPHYMSFRAYISPESLFFIHHHHYTI